MWSTAYRLLSSHDIICSESTMTWIHLLWTIGDQRHLGLGLLIDRTIEPEKFNILLLLCLAGSGLSSGQPECLLWLWWHCIQTGSACFHTPDNLEYHWQPSNCHKCCFHIEVWLLVVLFISRMQMVEFYEVCRIMSDGMYTCFGFWISKTKEHRCLDTL